MRTIEILKYFKLYRFTIDSYISFYCYNVCNNKIIENICIYNFIEKLSIYVINN